MMKQVKFKMPRRALVLTGGLLLAASSWAQSGAIKGQVKDAAGEPVMGATITANGKAVGVTDLDGNYSINVAPGTEITITYIGMTPQKVAAANGAVITLQDDSKTLNDVVVIGYGVAKKNDLTGSVTAIKPDEMNHGLQTNATDMIQGKIAGVNVISNDGTPGGGATIRVRGGSSLNASNDPLIVIDGLAMDSYGVKGLSNPLSMVNPNDIESFTVLKDASATAIYGSRASNGVIIITTKKGRKGQRTPKVSYSGNLTIATKRKTLDVLDGPEFTSFVEKLYGKDSEAYKALGWTDDKGVQHFANTDWQDEIYRTAVSHDHNITVTGGVANMPYRVSLGYTNNQGIVKTSDFSRYTASFNLSPSFLNDHLTFNINGKGMIAKNHYADGGAIGAAAYMDPTKPVTADNTIYNKYFGGYTQWYMPPTRWPCSTRRTTALSLVRWWATSRPTIRCMVSRTCSCMSTQAWTSPMAASGPTTTARAATITTSAIPVGLRRNLTICSFLCMHSTATTGWARVQRTLLTITSTSWAATSTNTTTHRAIMPTTAPISTILSMPVAKRSTRQVKSMVKFHPIRR